MGHHICKARPANRHLSLHKHSEFARVLIGTNHIMPEIGTAHAKAQAQIAPADHGDFHRIISLASQFEDHR
jgi:hypothetical protein